MLPKSPRLVHQQEALTHLGVSASGDDAVGQVAHGVFNVYADALALDIKARSPEEFLNLLNILTNV